MLLDAALLPRLEQLSLVARRVRAGQSVGERRSTKRGTSVEFADYRDYTRGDDLRRVDWNIYARLERPYVKLFEEEEDLAVHVLLDGSGSMDWGSDSASRRVGESASRQVDENKWLYARRLAAARAACTPRRYSAGENRRARHRLAPAASRAASASSPSTWAPAAAPCTGPPRRTRRAWPSWAAARPA